MIRLLIESGVNVLAHTSDGDSVLHIALCGLGDDSAILGAVMVLVVYGCDPFAVDSRGTAPLHIAVERGHVSIARYLLSLGAPLPSDLLVTLNHDWSYWCTVPMIHLLAKHGANVLAHAGNGDTVLHIALQSSYNDDEVVKVVEALVDHGCDPLEANSRGNTPLHIAVERGYISAARFLLAFGAPLPSDLLVTLNRDWSSWSTGSMVQFVVENGVDVLAQASDGDSVLQIALRCFNDDSDVLEATRILVGYGCDPLGANSRGETPLHIAASRSYVSVARYLIAQGASVLTKASNGDTVLHFATSAVYLYPHPDDDDDDDTLEAVKFLVSSGCELAVPNDDRKTPLHIAVDLGRLKTTKYLLSLNIPLPPDILVTAIQSHSNSYYCRHIIEALVTSGCDVQTPNSGGLMPLQVAIIKGKVDVVEYLLSVVSVHNPPLQTLLSATTLAPASVQSEMRRVLSDRRTRSESPLGSRQGITMSLSGEHFHTIFRYLD